MPKTSVDAAAARRWYLEAAIAYLAAIACLFAFDWRLHDLIWGFWITSMCMFYVMLFAFFVFLYRQIFPGSHWSTIPVFAFLVLIIFGVGIVMPFFIIGDQAVALNKRFPLPLPNVGPQFLLPYTLEHYWPLVLTVIASHWRVLVLQRTQEEKIALPFVLAFAVLLVLHILTGVLVAAAWLLNVLGIHGAEKLLACIVLAFAFAPLESGLRLAIRKLQHAHAERMRSNLPRQPPPTA